MSFKPFSPNCAYASSFYCAWRCRESYRYPRKFCRIKRGKCRGPDNGVAITRDKLSRLIDILVASVEFTLSQVERTVIPLRDPPMVLLYPQPSTSFRLSDPTFDRSRQYCSILLRITRIIMQVLNASTLNKYNNNIPGGLVDLSAHRIPWALLTRQTLWQPCFRSRYIYSDPDINALAWHRYVYIWVER